MVSRIIKIGSLVFALVIILIVILGALQQSKLPDPEVLVEGSKAAKLLGMGISLTQVLVYLCGFALLIGVVVSLVFKPKRGVLLLIALVIAAVVFGVSYGMSPGEASQALMKNSDVVVPKNFKLVGAAFYAMVITIFLTAAVMIFDMIKGAFKG